MRRIGLTNTESWPERTYHNIITTNSSRVFLNAAVILINLPKAQMKWNIKKKKKNVVINHDHHILNSSVTNTVCENEVVALEVHDSVRAREAEGR